MKVAISKKKSGVEGKQISSDDVTRVGGTSLNKALVLKIG